MTLFTRWSILTSSLLTLLLVSGCSQSYNGALGFGHGAEYDPAYAQSNREAGSVVREPVGPRRSQDTIARFDDQQAPKARPARPSGTASASATGDYGKSTVELAADRTPQGGVSSSRLFGEFGGTSARQIEGASTDNIQRITFTTEGGDFDPDIDAEGTFVVFASTRHSEQPDLYYKKLGASSATRLTEDPSRDVMPDISPDGKLVVFASDRSGSWDIYMKEIGARTAIRLTDELTEEVHPTFSPDGRFVVYSSFNEQNGEWELTVIDINNPGVKTYLGPGLFPSWSPVDNRIVFQRARERGDRRFGIWVIEYVNGQSTLPTELAASSNSAAITPDWSPNGRHIVFTTVVDPGTQGQQAAGPTDIWLMTSDGSGRSRLTAGRFENLLPTWGSDGQVYFVSNRAAAGVQNIWAVRPDQALRLVPAQEAKLGDAGRVGPPLPGAP
ncbi:TolB family protein [Mucisphaera calidilacus]|uniref:Translocation protein TolB n=1 Tax=Mucisphaera calidilacus TaxID=2527982 RepID=A0A518BZD9_9BACT|nr:DPP IV N-terminal domain-containing protein [Mucisphaera calidilacus]QDU72329.1 translocation protein TolB [Mucisphaera calidilacus]